MLVVVFVGFMVLVSVVVVVALVMFVLLFGSMFWCRPEQV